MVVQEFLLGVVDARRGVSIRTAYIRPFESRGRMVTPTFANWARRGVLPYRRLTLITSNVRDFERIRHIERFDFVQPGHN